MISRVVFLKTKHNHLSLPNRPLFSGATTPRLPILPGPSHSIASVALSGWRLCTRSPPGSFYHHFNIEFKCLIPDTWAELTWCCRSCSWPAELLLLCSQFQQHLPVRFPHDIITLKQKPNLGYSWDLSTFPGTMPGTEWSSIMAAWCLDQSAGTFIPSTGSILSVTEHKGMRFQCEMKWCWFLKVGENFHQRECRDSIQSQTLDNT